MFRGRWLLLADLVFTTLVGASAHEPQRDLLPGDYGYKHDLYHEYYQVVFGGGHCVCGDGECRVTKWRPTEMNSPVGVDVIVDRHWWPLQKGVYQPDPKMVPLELRNDQAHICAYGGYHDPDHTEKDTAPVIPCVIINLNGS